MTHQYVFDYHDGDIYWCTADVGWVTGHSYIVYGPLANGAVTLMFEGVPNYPTASRFWHVVDKWGVNTFYTAPTAIRSLMGAGDDLVKRTDRSSLRLLGSVGEPINPEAWEWYYRVVGDNRCPIVDTWWQTETGGIMITPLPGAIGPSPARQRSRSSASSPLSSTTRATRSRARRKQSRHPRRAGRGGRAPSTGITSGSCRPTSRPIRGPTSPATAAAATGTATTGSPAASTTSSTSRGTAWAPPRSSALVAHPKVAEAAVVGYPHDLKGQGIYCYVALNAGEQGSDALRKELVGHVRKVIGPTATPDLIQFAPGLPKTRSGKIMRRILRKIAEDDFSNLGDTSTLADPHVVDDLIGNRQNRKAS